MIVVEGILPHPVLGTVALHEQLEGLLDPAVSRLITYFPSSPTVLPSSGQRFRDTKIRHLHYYAMLDHLSVRTNPVHQLSLLLPLRFQTKSFVCSVLVQSSFFRPFLMGRCTRALFFWKEPNRRALNEN